MALQLPQAVRSRPEFSLVGVYILQMLSPLLLTVKLLQMVGWQEMFLLWVFSPAVCKCDWLSTQQMQGPQPWAGLVGPCRWGAGLSGPQLCWLQLADAHPIRARGKLAMLSKLDMAKMTCCGLTWQAAKHHTFVHSLPFFPVGRGRESGKRKQSRTRGLR